MLLNPGECWPTARNLDVSVQVSPTGPSSESKQPYPPREGGGQKPKKKFVCQRHVASQCMAPDAAVTAPVATAAPTVGTAPALVGERLSSSMCGVPCGAKVPRWVLPSLKPIMALLCHGLPSSGWQKPLPCGWHMSGGRLPWLYGPQTGVRLVQPGRQAQFGQLVWRIGCLRWW